MLFRPTRMHTCSPVELLLLLLVVVMVVVVVVLMQLLLLFTLTASGVI